MARRTTRSCVSVQILGEYSYQEKGGRALRASQYEDEYKDEYEDLYEDLYEDEY